jgi:hypothetical protein
MQAWGLVQPPGFSLQYQNLTPSHAEYAKVGTRSTASIIYYYTGFQFAVRWPNPLPPELTEQKQKAYYDDILQLGYLFQRLVEEVCSQLEPCLPYQYQRKPNFIFAEVHWTRCHGEFSRTDVLATTTILRGESFCQRLQDYRTSLSDTGSKGENGTVKVALLVGLDARLLL